MPAKKEAEQSNLTVLVPFAYAAALNGQVVQLVKGDVVDPKKYTKESMEHLQSIGFVGFDN